MGAAPLFRFPPIPSCLLAIRVSFSSHGPWLPQLRFRFDLVFRAAYRDRANQIARKRAEKRDGLITRNR